MKYLVDTDWVIDYLKGQKRATEMLASLSSDGVAISLISYGEIYEGIFFGKDPKRHEKDFLKFLRWVPVLFLTKPIMKQCIRMRGSLRQSGQLISDFDLLIAATAIHHRLTLLTHNKRHFHRISALKLYQ